MNRIVLISFALTLTLVFFLILYLIPYFSKKKIRKGKFDLLQFLKLFFAPVLIIPMTYFLKQIIELNAYVQTITFPKYVSELVFLTLLYFLILGNGIHAVSVVLSKHMRNLKSHRIWEINEYFHNAFSHFLATASAALILFSFAVYEINRPNIIFINNFELAILVISGVVFGIILSFASIEGSIPQVMFYLLYLLSLMLPFIFIRFNLNYRLFPFTTFVETMFITSVIMISFYKYKIKGFPEIVPQHFFED